MFLELLIIFGTLIFLCLAILAAGLVATRITYGMWFPPRNEYGNVDMRLKKKR